MQRYTVFLLDNIVTHSDNSRLARPRAQRFDLQLPLRYRARGETAWLNGQTVNISYTGVFFWTQKVMEVDDGLDMSFEVPVEFGGRGAEILCRGEIVRTVLPPSTDAGLGVAARILACRFVRGRKSAP